LQRATNQPPFLLILKKLLKYSVTLLILLVVGCSQLFVCIFKVNTHQVVAKEIKEAVHVQGLSFKDAELKEIYFEEEEKDDEQNTNYLSSFPYIDLKENFFIPRKSYASFPQQFLFSSLAGSQYILNCVFRI
jgi:hypothetical protein